MPKPTLDADTILKRAAPVTGQHAHEIQPFGHLVRMPIASKCAQPSLVTTKAVHRSA